MLLEEKEKQGCEGGCEFKQLISGARIHEVTILLTGYTLTYEDTIDALLTMDDYPSIITDDII